VAEVAESPVTVVQVGADSVLTLLVAGIISVCDSKLLERPELGLDEVKPRGLRGSPDGMDVQFLEQTQEAGVVMHQVQVVEDDEQLAVG